MLHPFTKSYQCARAQESQMLTVYAPTAPALLAQQGAVAAKLRVNRVVSAIAELRSSGWRAQQVTRYIKCVRLWPAWVLLRPTGPPHSLRCGLGQVYASHMHELPQNTFLGSRLPVLSALKAVTQPDRSCT
mgnify:CR=1 FL=1